MPFVNGPVTLTVDADALRECMLALSARQADLYAQLDAPGEGHPAFPDSVKNAILERQIARTEEALYYFAEVLGEKF